MSTKNLARTVIEPGRTRYSKRERAQTNRVERRQSRALEHACSRDPALGEARVDPRRDRYYLSQRDKLGPLRSFLRSRCGLPWSDVYAEIRARFDFRTTAGRHIVYDHLLSDVVGNGITREHPYRHRFYRDTFRVDEAGVLRHVPGTRWRPDPQHLTTRPRAEVVALCRGRQVRRVGDALFWMVRADRGCAFCEAGTCAIDPVYESATRVFLRARCGRFLRFRQDERLDTEEVRVWESLTEADRRGFEWVPIRADEDAE